MARDHPALCPLTLATALRPIFHFAQCQSARMNFMRKASPFLLALVLTLSLPGLLATPPAAAQSANGGIDLTARVAPTGARPEPVRQFTFYVLTKSYADILKDVEE